MNPRICAILLLTTLVALFMQQQSEAGLIGNILPGEYYERIYDRISRHLEKRFPSEKDPSTDMKRANTWLENKISYAKFTVEKDTLSTVLDQLKGLEELKNDKKCDSKSYKVLQAINRGTRGLALKNRFEFESNIRIVRMVHHYFVSHAASCNQHYFELLDSDSGMNESDHETVQTIRDGFFKALIHNSEIQGWYENLIYKQPPKPVWETAIQFRSTEGMKKDFQRYVLLIVGAKPSLFSVKNPEAILKYLSRGDHDNKCLVNEEGKDLDSDSVKVLYIKYMVDPCKNYVEHKAGFWNMYTFDRTLIDFEHDFNLKRAAIGFGVCKDLVDKIQKPLFSRIIERLSSN